LTAQIEINSEHFILHPGGGIYWVERRMLLIADVHFGKVAHFRKHGAAIPVKASEENYRKLNDLNDYFKPEVICFLGDLFHSYLNNEWFSFESWISSLKCKVILISGNHDIISPHKYEAIEIEVHESLVMDSFLLTHQPHEHDALFNFSGHVHPGVRMLGAGRQRVRLACFYKTNKQLILPAFGTFTGKHIIAPKAGDEIYAIVSGEVICVS
jgi:DNA ligase-associated metallophosphoesterase